MPDPQAAIFTSLRAAIETTRGTAVNPTRIIEQTTFDHTPGGPELILPAERRGSFFMYYRAAAGREQHDLVSGGNLSFNQAAWLGNFYFKGNTTGTGAGADKTYTFVPTSNADDLKSATFEWGYNPTPSATQPGFRLPFVVGSSLELTFDKTNAEGVTHTANWHSPKAVSQITTFGGSPTALTTEAMTPVQTAVTIDAAGGTIGTTADNYVQKAVFTIANTWVDIDTLNGTTAAQDTFKTQREPDLVLTRYFINDNELDRYVDKAKRKIRVTTTGPTLGGSNYKVTLDYYGVLATDGHKHGEVDGIIWETLHYRPIYDQTATTDHSLTVVTAEASIT